MKIIDPSAITGQFWHMGTTRMQHSLLKICLLLGVRFRFGKTIAQPPELSRIFASSEVFLPTGPHQINRRCDVLVDATGARCPLFNTLGFEHVTAFKGNRAIAFVCNFVFTKRRPKANASEGEIDENRLEENSFGTTGNKFKVMFDRLKAEGIDLENLVYYRSDGAFSPFRTHYVVATASPTSLHERGVLCRLQAPPPASEEQPQKAFELCAPSNVDKAKLEEYARAAVAEFVPNLERCEFVDDKVQALQIFDFSERKESNKVAVFVTASELVEARTPNPTTVRTDEGATTPRTEEGRLVIDVVSEGSATERVLVTRIGDALQEPFWPEGLGVNRGFLHAFDCVEMVQGFAGHLSRVWHGEVSDTSEELQKIIDYRRGLFNIAKSVNGNSRAQLKPEETSTYEVDPKTRYTKQPEVRTGHDGRGTARILPRVAW